jgi:hypothetical protein
VLLNELRRLALGQLGSPAPRRRFVRAIERLALRSLFRKQTAYIATLIAILSQTPAVPFLTPRIPPHITSEPTRVALLDLAERKGRNRRNPWISARIAARVLGIAEQNIRYHAGVLCRQRILIGVPRKTGKRGRPPWRYRIAQPTTETPVAIIGSTAGSVSDSPELGLALVLHLRPDVLSDLRSADGSLDLVAELLDRLGDSRAPAGEYRISRVSDRR